MSQKGSKNKSQENKRPDVAYVRLGQERAEWLRRRGNKGLPAELKRIVDKEMMREEVERERKR